MAGVTSETKHVPRSEVCILRFDILAARIVRFILYFSFGNNAVNYGSTKYRVLPLKKQKAQ